MAKARVCLNGFRNFGISGFISDEMEFSIYFFGVWNWNCALFGIYNRKVALHVNKYTLKYSHQNNS